MAYINGKFRIHLRDIKSVTVTNSPSGPLYSVTYTGGGQDHQVTWDYIYHHATQRAREKITRTKVSLA